MCPPFCHNKTGHLIKPYIGFPEVSEIWVLKWGESLKIFWNILASSVLLKSHFASSRAIQKAKAATMARALRQACPKWDGNVGSTCTVAWCPAPPVPIQLRRNLQETMGGTCDIDWAPSWTKRTQLASLPTLDLVIVMKTMQWSVHHPTAVAMHVMICLFWSTELWMDVDLFTWKLAILSLLFWHNPTLLLKALEKNQNLCLHSLCVKLTS